jgi:hypothetical protein
VRDQGGRNILCRRQLSIGAAWAVISARLVALVRAGAKFENGVLVERPDQQAATLTPHDRLIHRP